MPVRGADDTYHAAASATSHQRPAASGSERRAPTTRPAYAQHCVCSTSAQPELRTLALLRLRHQQAGRNQRVTCYYYTTTTN